MVTGLEEGDGHARSISVGGMLLSREAADSGAEWWVSAQRADWETRKAARAQAAKDGEERERETGRLEIPVLQARGEFREETVGSLRLHVEETGLEGCAAGICRVFLIYSAYYFPPDYREHLTIFVFHATGDTRARKRGEAFAALFPELALLKAVEASFRDERQAGQPGPPQ
jgi:hypothetical protein